MIDRVLEIYAASCYLDYSYHYSALISLQAIHIFLELEENTSIKCHELSEAQLKVLEDVRELLSIPHAVQEIVSAEKTPTLPIVVPDYYIYFAWPRTKFLGFPMQLMHLSRSSKNISPKHERIGSMCSPWVRVLFPKNIFIR